MPARWTAPLSARGPAAHPHPPFLTVLTSCCFCGPRGSGLAGSNLLFCQPPPGSRGLSYISCVWASPDLELSIKDSRRQLEEEGVGWGTEGTGAVRQGVARHDVEGHGARPQAREYKTQGDSG